MSTVGMRVQILGHMYSVVETDEEERTLTLDHPISAVEYSNNPLPLPMKQGEPAEVWLLEECSAAPNPDMQLLLFNLEVHAIALKY